MFLLTACLVVLSVVAAAAAATKASPPPPSTASPNTYLPRLPVGEYRIVYEALYPCEDTRNHPIALNIYFSKTSRTETEIRGNVTLKIPGDDNLIFELNLCSWSSRGGWIQNSMHYRSKNFCTEATRLMGKAMDKLLRIGNSTVTKCPVPVGTYIMSGVTTQALDDNKLPKVYFYGKYKLVIYFRNKNNDLLGCSAMELRLVRPWEMPQY